MPDPGWRSVARPRRLVTCLMKRAREEEDEQLPAVKRPRTARREGDGWDDLVEDVRGIIRCKLDSSTKALLAWTCWDEYRKWKPEPGVLLLPTMLENGLDELVARAWPNLVYRSSEYGMTTFARYDAVACLRLELERIRASVGNWRLMGISHFAIETICDNLWWRRGRTMYEACVYGAPRSLRLLVEEADGHPCNGCLQIAISFGHLACARYIVRRNVLVPTSQWLTQALSSKSLPMVRYVHEELGVSFEDVDPLEAFPSGPCYRYAVEHGAVNKMDSMLWRYLNDMGAWQDFVKHLAS